MNRGINHDGTYKQAVEVDWIDAAILPKELIEIYSTPTPKRWSKLKKVIDFVFDWLMLFTIAGVWYLYPEPKNEPYSNSTQYNSLV